ncbi:cysteine synthase family protein [Kribbella sp. NPDC051718]|uniref:PLP-dependent cysteine synthase family protein n=1 Tax=Kribbella sp. NPDC051718 TaxID=3155168 RepID=UPI003436FAF7
MILTSALQAIGNTPVVRLQRIVPDGSAQVLVKLEGGNPTGSYKDRMALAMIEGAERRGDLQPGQRVVEFTGGSTGSSLAFICAVKGYPLSVVSSDAFSPEKLRTMQAFGADLVVVPSDQGRITPDLFVRMRHEVDQIVASENAFWTDQFNNPDALDGYAILGRELLDQTAGTALHTFCGAVGTGGMLVGVGRTIRPHIDRIVALEPASSPALTKGFGGSHRVEGTATGAIPPLLVDKPYDEARAIEETEARDLVKALSQQEGVFSGTSAALNVLGAIQLASELSPNQTVVTVAADTGLKYLAGDLYL